MASSRYLFGHSRLKPRAPKIENQSVLQRPPRSPVLSLAPICQNLRSLPSGRTRAVTRGKHVWHASRAARREYFIIVCGTMALFSDPHDYMSNLFRASCFFCKGLRLNQTNQRVCCMPAIEATTWRRLQQSSNHQALIVLLAVKATKPVLPQAQIRHEKANCHCGPQLASIKGVAASI